jgi:cytochrome b561
MAATHYSALQRAFHWLIALLVLGNFGGAFIAENLGEESEAARQIMGLHLSTGMLILLLVIARLITRLAEKVPAPLASLPAWQKRLAVAGHRLLYLLVLLMPVSGYLMVTAHGGEGPGFYGLFRFPALVDENEGLNEFAHEVHGILAWVFLITIAGHAGFALKHHFVDRDATLRRMVRGE